MAPRRKTVEECGMERTTTTFSPDMVEFMAPSLAVPGSWKAYKIRGSRRSGSEHTQFSHYAINIEAGAYCTLPIITYKEDDFKGITKLDYRDMIIDNYTAAGADPAEMKVLGTRNILNAFSRTKIEETFKSKQQDPTKSGSIRLDASEASIDAFAILHPFEKDNSCLANDCGQHIGFAEPSAFIALSEGCQSEDTSDGTDSQPAYHLIAILEPSKESDIETAVRDVETGEAKKISMKNTITLIDDAIGSLEDAKDDGTGDQRIRDAIKVLDDAIRQLRS